MSWFISWHQTMCKNTLEYKYCSDSFNQYTFLYARDTDRKYELSNLKE